jgi:pimeloyl-ACP methyl ester carboxylesterase
VASATKAPESHPAAAPEAAPHAAADHVTPYDRLVWDDEEIEGLLAAGEQRDELQAFFGAAEYRLLVRLARAAHRTTVARTDAYPTIIVPGIMGTQLGMSRHAPLPRDILWLDPVDIGFGRLTELTLPSAARVGTQGVVLYTYLRLKLHLRAAGVRPLFHPYDWRLGIDVLGRELAARLRSEPSAKIALVAHSMGGLVCRAALACPGAEKVERLVLLGTPHFGSFAPVQALRGCCSVVRKIARLDSHHTPERLAAEVFNTFPSLYHMLPAAGYSGTLDLFDVAAWPRSGPRPVPELLEAARTIHEVLAPADERCVNVIGVGHETVTAIARRGDQFVYTVTRHGDGTVPVACAHLAGARNFHAAVAHSELARDPTVASAVIDLLRRGATRRLASHWKTASRAEARISDRELRHRSGEKVDWARLTPEERRSFLQNLNEPPKLRLCIPLRASKRRRPHARRPPA